MTNRLCSFVLVALLPSHPCLLKASQGHLAQFIWVALLVKNCLSSDGGQHVEFEESNMSCMRRPVTGGMGLMRSGPDDRGEPSCPERPRSSTCTMHIQIVISLGLHIYSMLLDYETPVHGCKALRWPIQLSPAQSIMGVTGGVHRRYMLGQTHHHIMGLLAASRGKPKMTKTSQI